MLHNCSKCGETDPTKFYPSHATRQCKSCQRARQREYYRTGGKEYYKDLSRTRRSKAIEILGNKCVWCGFNDVRALQIDHMWGGGCKEQHRVSVTRILNGDHDDLQLLCANCNWIKRVENKEYS